MIFLLYLLTFSILLGIAWSISSFFFYMKIKKIKETKRIKISSVIFDCGYYEAEFVSVPKRELPATFLGNIGAKIFVKPLVSSPGNTIIKNKITLAYLDNVIFE